MPKDSIQPIIFLSGPVGAGKTTVAKELVKSSPHLVTCIKGDQFWFFIAKGGDVRGRSKNFKTIMSSMTAAAVPYALAGYEVIVDFSIPPWFLETAQKILTLRSVPLNYVILCPSLEVCRSLAADRKEGIISDYEFYKEFYDTFQGMEKHTIRDDEGDPKVLAAVIRIGLEEGKFRV